MCVRRNTRGLRQGEQVWGCERLESRVVMGITGGHAERNSLGRMGPSPSARHFYEDHGAEKTGWFSHWTQQQGKRECDSSHQSEHKLHVY